MYDKTPAAADAIKKGVFGIPGTIARNNIIPLATAETTGNAVNCLVNVLPKFSLLPEVVTNIPAAVEINNAGIWLTRPSPTVNLTYVCAASTIDMSF